MKELIEPSEARDGRKADPRNGKRFGDPATMLRRLRRFAAGRDQRRRSLRTTLAILQAQQNATLDGILVVATDGTVLSCNRRFLEIWNLPTGFDPTGTNDALLQHAVSQVADPAAFLANVRWLYAHPDVIRTGDIIEMRSGSIFSRTSIPVISDLGQVIGRAWYFTDVTEAKRAEKLERALFRISEVTREASDLGALFESLHQIVGELMYARNFYIALYDEKKRHIDLPYFVDEIDAAPPEQPSDRGLTGYVLRTGTPLLVGPEAFQQMVSAGDVESIGAPSVDWLGVPLKSGDRTFGVLGVQSYTEEVRFGEREKDLLLFVSQHVAAAIEHKTKEEAIVESETRYRQMFENNRAVKLVIDPDTGEITDANLAACDFYGYSREKLASMYVWDLNPLPREVIEAEMQKAKLQNRSFFLFQHRLANGEMRDVEVHSGPIHIRGRQLLYSIIHDITDRKQTERALVESEAKFRSIFDFAPVGIYQSTPEGEFLTVNATLARILGYESPDEVMSRHLGEDIYFFTEDRLAVVSRYESTGRAADLEVIWKKKDGKAIWVQLNAHAIRDEEGKTLYFEGFVYDITERKRAESTMQSQSAAMEASMDGIAILSDHGQFTYVNQAFVRLYGYSDPEDLLGRRWTMLFDAREYRRFVNDVMPDFRKQGQWRGESAGRRRSGSVFPQELSLTVIENGGFVCVVRDITERTYAEEQIKHLAYHDVLTSLPNRLLFKDRLSVAIAQAQRTGRKVAVLFLDLDHFKKINDSVGHNVGDQLLQHVASRIQACIRESDTVARFGGDEFTVLLSTLTRADDAVFIATKILESIRHPFHLSGKETFISTSIGISVHPDDGEDAETLIKNADTAMYQAKDAGRDTYQLFNATISARALERLALETGLRKALINEEFVLHYQPILDRNLGRVHGMEALIRWRHPELGLIHPADFIPIAETTGLMGAIGAWALRRACRDAVQWQRCGFRSLSVSINLSVTQLQQTSLVHLVRSVLEETMMDPSQVELEITETSAMQDPENSITVLNEIKALGVRISLDDFGIGHSSLGYLKRFPIDTLKIDQSFVRDISTDPDTANIVTAIIAMAHKLRLRVVAEGVETAEQRDFLDRSLCDRMQGFLFERPIPPAEFEEFLRRNMPEEGADRPPIPPDLTFGEA
ncbi:MAG: EAL domain-containing protein [Thermoanaerobaculia bacterium]